MTYHPQQPYPGQYPPGYGYVQPPMKQSGFGLASIILGVIAGVGLAICLAVAAIGVSKNPAIADDPTLYDDPNWVQNDKDGTMMMVGIAGCGMIGMIGMGALGLLGGVFGLIGTFTSTRKKTLGIVGLCINGLLVIAFLFLIVISQVA